MSEDKFHAILSEQWDAFEQEELVGILMEKGFLHGLYFGPKPNTIEAKKRKVYIVQKPFKYRDELFNIGNLF